jgi:hypothetical protein
MRQRNFLGKWFVSFALVTFVLAWHFRDDFGDPSQRLTAIVVSLLIYIILYFVIRSQNAKAPDQVLDGGTFLQLTFNGRVDTIQLSNVETVETHKLLRLTRISLHLRSPTESGSVVTFYPLQGTDAGGENAVAKALRARISVRPTSEHARGES